MTRECAVAHGAALGGWGTTMTTMTMRTPRTDWLILPYDGSVVARATLRRAAAAICTRARDHTPEQDQAGVLLAVAGIEPEALGDLLQEAGAVVAPDIVLQAQLLPPGDPLGSLQRLLACLPATLAAPLDPHGAAPWCVAAWQLDVPMGAKVMFFLTPEDLHAVTPTPAHRGAGTRVVGRPHHPRREHVGRTLILLGGLGVATLGALTVDLVVQSHMAASWVYLLVVLPVALRWGCVLGIATAALAAVLLLTVLVEPRFSFAVADGRDVSRVALSLGGMVSAALLVQAHGSTVRASPRTTGPAPRRSGRRPSVAPPGG